MKYCASDRQFDTAARAVQSGQFSLVAFGLYHWLENRGPVSLSEVHRLGSEDVSAIDKALDELLKLRLVFVVGDDGAEERP